jgi:membrane-bound serine protease (ClpP class)
MLMWLWLALSLALSSVAHAQSGEVLVAQADGDIVPAMRGYLERAIQAANDRGAQALVIELNTPGGLVLTMNEIVQAMRASRVPVIVYVAPAHGMAASAGTIVTLAGHVAAMAPGTIIGAAIPISGGGENLPDDLATKEKEALKATVRDLAAQRGDEAIQLAEDAIEEGKAVNADEALRAGLIDFIATDRANLLRQLDGRVVSVQDRSVTLRTGGVVPTEFPMTGVEQLLLWVSDPNVASILLSIGSLAILSEISNPGTWVPGTIGVICLSLFFYSTGSLAVNWLGLVFIGLAFILFILDIKAPTHGALTLAGAASLVAGLLILFNSPGTPSYAQVSVPLVVGMALVIALFFAFIVARGIQAQRRPAITGTEALIGQVGEARTALNPAGNIFLMGELWSATAVDGPVAAGEPVEVVGRTGLRLTVRPLKAPLQAKEGQV